MVNTRTARVAIVGLGPRGLLLLERLLTLAGDRRQVPLNITVYEPGDPGVGVHDRTQPDYLMLNTVAGQLSVFPDLPSVACGPVRAGPSLYGWCTARGIRLDRRGHPSGAADARPVTPGDFLPRSLLGEYLLWSFERIRAELPTQVRLTIHREAAVECRRDAATDQWFLRGSRGTEANADALFLCTGHTGTAPRVAGVMPAYPSPDTLSDVRPGDTVAIAGYGLCAMDAVAALTEGRGGRFQASDGASRYKPSGREPRILLFSRSGRPFHARPGRFDPARARAQPFFLTAAAVEAMREQAPGRQLDFERHVLPLMRDEMRAAYYLGCALMVGGASAVASVQGALMSMRDAGAREHAFERLRQSYGPYDPTAALCTTPVALPVDAYAAWFRQWIARDLDESRKGLAQSPDKAALEVWRDLREPLRTIVAGEGLTPASRATFYGIYAPLANRLVGGPQLERHEDLLALLDAGVVRVLPAAHAVAADHLIQAQVPSSALPGTDSPLLRQMYLAGDLRQLADLGTIDVDVDGHPRDANGCSVRSAWIFGPAAEGASYYNHYVASGGGYCRAFHDAQRAAAECLSLVCADAPEAVPTT
jgi:hypothetical protein